jgi:cephalosporin hydroxylase
VVLPITGPRTNKKVIDRFHRLYYYAQLRGGTWADTRWLGARIGKCPLDLFCYQELVFETRPELVIETGTFEGGSAFYFASLLDLIGSGRVVTIDVQPRDGRPAHERITYLTGSSTAPEIIEQVGALAADASRVLVVLDSDHSRDHVIDELHAYSELVTTGSYMIVEDTNVNGHPVVPEFGPGPMEAVESFLAEDDRFVIDRSREKFLLTFNPSGYLRRVA